MTQPNGGLGAQGDATVTVDTSVCIGNGVCGAFAPEYFELSDDYQVSLLRDQVAPDDIPAVQEAVGSCPVGAIILHNNPFA